MCMYILVHVRLCVFSQKLARWADLSGDRVVSGDLGAGERGAKEGRYVRVSTYIMSMQTLLWLEVEIFFFF